MKKKYIVPRKINRREFLACTGAGAVALTLAGCGVDFSQDRGGGEGPSDVSGDFSWTRAEGSTINLLFAQHPMADSYIPELPNFKEKTNIEVRYETLPEEEFFQKLLTDLSTGQGNYDAFMTGPPTTWQFAAPGWIEPLDGYINNPSLTEESYNFEDFYPSAVEVNTWNDSLYAIPANEEGYCLFYRKDILEEAGMPVPQTFDELVAAAGELDGKTFGGKQITGFVARGNKTFPTIGSGYSTAFLGYGATDVKDGNVLINSPEGVQATEKWAEVMNYSPPNVGTFTWYEAMNYFAAGDAAFFIDADHMAETFENPESSQVAGKVGYAMPPKGAAGRGSEIWLWSLGMSSGGQNKTAAWLFLQWATSKELLEKSIPQGNINPTRQSLANSQTMQEYTSDWGDYNQVWQDILKELAGWHYIKSPKYPEMGDRWALAVQEVALGRSTAQAALDAAAKDIEGILEGAEVQEGE